MFTSLAGLLLSAFAFAALYPSGGLFVLSVETSRLDYEGSGQSRGEIWLDGVLVQAGGRQVVDAGAHPGGAALAGGQAAQPTVGSAQAYFCYSGAITPGPGARVELSLRDGAQYMQITPAPYPNPGETAHQPTTLRYNGRQLVLTHDHAAPPVAQPNAAGNALMLLPLDDDSAGEDAFQGLDFGDLELPGKIEIFADPGCAQGARPVQGFGKNGAVITIDGPAVLGRKLRPVDGDYLVDDDIPFLSGTVEVMISQVLCAERFLGVFSGNRTGEMVGCDRIYRIAAEPMTLPPGAAILSEIAAAGKNGRFAARPENPPAPFFGQVVFQGGRYHVTASTEADRFIILRPGKGGRLSNGNALSVPFVERVLLEPSLIVFASLFFALSGLVLGIMQVEDED